MEPSNYIRRIMNLHQDAIPGRWSRETNDVAPHKPLLLVSVLDEYIENPSKQNAIEPTLQIEERFDHYWERITKPAHKSTMALPFFHLKNDGFWHLIPRPGKEAALRSSAEVNRSMTVLRQVVKEARLDPELHALLSSTEWAHHLRSIVIAFHFSPEVHERFF